MSVQNSEWTLNSTEHDLFTLYLMFGFALFPGGVRDRLGFPSIWCQKLNTVHVLSSGSSHFCLSNDVDPPVMWAHILVANELMFLLFPRYRILDI